MKNADTASSLITRTTLRFRARMLYRWVDGAITTTHRRLGDALNREDSPGLLLAEEFFVEGSEHATGEGFGALNTNAILYMVPIESGGPPTGRDPFAWVKKRPERVKIGTGPFEIEGDLYMTEGARLKDMLGVTKPVFVVLKDATIRRADDPGFLENHPAAFVNRRAMDFIVPVSQVR
jgi:hypothetical protein